MATTGDIINPRLKKRDDGLYEIRYSLKGATRYYSRVLQTGKADRRQAQALLAGFVDGVDRADEALSSPNVSRVLTAYKLRLESHRPHAATQFICLEHLERHLGAVTATQLTDQHIRGYAATRAVASSTLRRELGVLRAAYGYAVKTKIMAPGDAPFIELPRAGQARSVYLNDVEERRFFQLAMDDSEGAARLTRLTRFIAIALCTAARRDAILKLKWSQVDLVTGIIDFRVAGAEVHNKKRAPIPISARLAPILARAFEERDLGSEYVLDTPTPIRSAWERFTKRHDFEHIHIHDLRRTWCSLALQSGANLMSVSQVMADDPASIAKHYAQFMENGARDAVDARG